MDLVWKKIPGCKSDAWGNISRWTVWELNDTERFPETLATIRDNRQTFGDIHLTVFSNVSQPIEFDDLRKAKKAAEKIVRENAAISATQN